MNLSNCLLLYLLISLVYTQEVLETLSWGTSNQNIRLYYEDYGEIREMIRSPTGAWNEGSFNYPGYSVSGIVYIKMGRKFRLYVGYESRIQEYIDTGNGWGLGDLYVVGEIADASYYFDSLGSLHIKVIVVRNTKDVYEYLFDEAKVGLPGKGWTQGKYIFTIH